MVTIFRAQNILLGGWKAGNQVTVELINRQTVREKDERTDRQTDREKDIQTYTHAHTDREE